MAGRQQQIAAFTDLRGRDGHTAAELEIPGNKARECLNVDFYRTTFARKRGGTRSLPMTGSGLVGVICAMHRHVPDADDRFAELWAVDNAPFVVSPASGPRLAQFAGTAWHPIAWKANIGGPPWEINWVSFNGKLYILGDQGTGGGDRMQVYDPATSTTSLRYVGLGTPAAPTTTNGSATGTLPPTPRWYRVTFTVNRDYSVVVPTDTGITVRRSIASPVKTYTPTAPNTAVRVTMPALLGEGETHWETWGADTEDGPFYLLQTLLIVTPLANNYFDDAMLPSDYYTQITLMPLQGDNAAPWSARYGIADDNRLLFAGAWEGGHSQNEVWFTPVLGSTSPLYADDERLPSTNKLSFNERDSGYITALGGPIGSSVIVFKDRQTWRIIPTGDVDDPYRRRVISRTVGCLHQRTVVVAEDETGIPTIYWLSAQGPYRYNLSSGLARLTWDVQDIWDRVNINAGTIIAHGVSHADKHQIWWWVAVDTAETPVLKIVYDTHLGRVSAAGLVRDGWAVHDGSSALAHCSVMFSNTATTATGTPQTSRDLKPYIGYSQAPFTVWKCDTPDLSDNMATFRAFVQLPSKHLAGLDKRCQLGHPAVLGSPVVKAPGPDVENVFSVQQSRDYGESERSADVVMEAGGTETRILRVVEGVESADASSVAIRVGDRVSVASAWAIDAVLQPFEVRDPVVL